MSVGNIRVIDVPERKKIDLKQFVKRTALPSDVKEIINESCIIREGGRTVVVYLVIDDIPVELVEVLKRIRYEHSNRTSGLMTRSRIVGYRPRETIRKDFCSSTSLARESPRDHATVCNFAAVLAKYYARYCPEIYGEHAKLTSEKILKEWIIPDSPFTSGIINKNNALKYHFDAGNFESVYSNMVGFKKDCMGGHLTMPEFDVGLEIADKSITLFDGQDILHGVTPFELTSAEGYRFTVVYYTLKQMWNCLPVNEEVVRYREKRWERSQKRYQRLTGELHDEDELVKNIVGKSDKSRTERNKEAAQGAV